MGIGVRMGRCILCRNLGRHHERRRLRFQWTLADQTHRSSLQSDADRIQCILRYRDRVLHPSQFSDNDRRLRIRGLRILEDDHQSDQGPGNVYRRNSGPAIIRHIHRKPCIQGMRQGEDARAHRFFEAHRIQCILRMLASVHLFHR